MFVEVMALDAPVVVFELVPAIEGLMEDTAADALLMIESLSEFIPDSKPASCVWYFGGMVMRYGGSVGPITTS
jgi:hypothetical protein